VTPKTIVSVLDSAFVAHDPALSRALALARWYDADLHVVHLGRSGDIANSTIGSAVAARAALGAHATPVRVVTAALSSSSLRAVADYANRVAAGLVVVGTRARRARGYWSAGSFATALGKTLQSPTIAVSGDSALQPAAAGPFASIVVPVDFSEASLGALAVALDLVQQSGGRLRLLHVLDGFPYETVYSGSRAVRLMHDLRARQARANRELQSLIPPDAMNWSDIDVATVPGVATEAIVAGAAERGADLLVLGLPRRSRLEDVVSGSTAHRVLRRTTAPVLLVPGPATARLARPAQRHRGRVAWHPSARGPLTAAGAGPAMERRAS
jgi:nucleotide-binding universal stress UspA family protein